MADISCAYVLTTPGPDITFNAGTMGDGTDKYWLSSIQGLDGPAIRAPTDLVAFGDGGYVHTFWKGPRRVIMEGWLLLEPLGTQEECVERFNDLEADLTSALTSIIQSSGTLAWTPAGQSALSLTVFNEVGVDIRPTDNYTMRTFSFGLISEAADPA